jgi:hypothetical protein
MFISHGFAKPGLLVFGVLLAAGLSFTAAEESAKSLIDPQLSAWQAYHGGSEVDRADVWSVNEEGVLICRGKPLGYLYTRDSFGNVILEFEWRWPQGKPPGRGGVLLRTTGDHKIWPKSLEVQLNTGDAGDYWGLAGYELSGPAERSKVIEHPEFGKLTNVKKNQPLEKEPGQWNHCRVHLVGAKATVEINGKPANSAIGCARRGPICLTSEGNEIHFRNVRVTVLK